MTKSQDERRHAERQDCEKLVRFEGDHFSIYSRATNLSARGAFLATHYLLDPGTQIQLHLVVHPSKGKAIKPARVVRSVSDTGERGEYSVGLGVEFLEEDPTIVP